MNSDARATQFVNDNRECLHDILAMAREITTRPDFEMRSTRIAGVTKVALHNQPKPLSWLTSEGRKERQARMDKLRQQAISAIDLVAVKTGRTMTAQEALYSGHIETIAGAREILAEPLGRVMLQFVSMRSRKQPDQVAALLVLRSEENAYDCDRLIITGSNAGLGAARELVHNPIAQSIYEPSLPNSDSLMSLRGRLQDFIGEDR